MQNNFSPSRKGVLKRYGKCYHSRSRGRCNQPSNGSCRNHPDCPCHRAERAADKFDLAPPPFDYAPDVAGNEIKLACIDKFMNAAYSDANKFWADFMEQVNILLDSRRYCRECKILGLKPEYVAEHIVFLGSATMKKVLKDGVSRTLGADVQLYGKRFSPEDADRFLSEDIKRLPEQTTVA